MARVRKKESHAPGEKRKSRKKVAMKPSQKAIEREMRKGVIATTQEMSQTGLSPGRSGNVSCRWSTGMLITPSGLAYDTLKPSDIVFVDHDGSIDEKARKPSSEWRFHLSVYATRPDAGAVVHTHSLHATVLASAHLPILPFHYMTAIAGGDDIPLIPYAPFGTDELADYVATGIAERDACLMANHGQIALGATLASALEMAQEVEVLAEQYYKVLLLDRVHLLDAEQMDDVLERFKNYRENAQKT